MALYIFPPVTLYKIIFLIPVVMALLIILDHLLIPTICIHHLSHLLSFCGITYQTVLKLLSLYLRLTYHITKLCYLGSLCVFRHKFHYRKCRTLWGRAWASWYRSSCYVTDAGVDEWWNIFKIRIFSVQCKLTQWTPHYLTPRRWIHWMRQTPHRVRVVYQVSHALPWSALIPFLPVVFGAGAAD